MEKEYYAWFHAVQQGGHQDISRRISLVYAAFDCLTLRPEGFAAAKRARARRRLASLCQIQESMESWDPIPLSKRLLVYEALVVSVLMYNSSCWAAPMFALNKLDKAHRRHLRSILNYRYPHFISNDNLYKRCNTEPLSARLARSRWRTLGHVLRGPTDAYSSLRFAVNTLQLQGRRGRPQSNLFLLIFKNLSTHRIL